VAALVENWSLMVARQTVSAPTVAFRAMIRDALALARDEMLLIFEIQDAATAPTTVIMTARPGQRARRLWLPKPMAQVTAADVRPLCRDGVDDAGG
jgi:hypothetical protein